MSALPARRKIVVVGGGMVAHRFVESLVTRLDDAGADAPDVHVTVLAEEPRAPYDRVQLTSYFDGRDPAALSLGDAGLWDRPDVTLRRSERVVEVDRGARTVRTATGAGRPGRTYPYDDLVLATGSSAFVPPVEGKDLPGCFVYRTLDDVAALRQYVETLHARPVRGRPARGAVIGGGLLGLEAAGALRALGVETHVVEFAPRLMPLQVDEGGGEALRRIVEGLGVTVHTSTATKRLLPARRGSRVGAVTRMDFAEDAGGLDVDVVVFAAGVRPRDELARACGLDVGARGGVVVDSSCRTADPQVWAIGEVACIQGRTLGLVAPGYAMAEVATDRILGGAGSFPGADLSTKLKLLGVDVASFGDAMGTTDGALSVVLADPVCGVYAKLVLSDDARTLLGGILVGDASAYASLRPMLGRELHGDPMSWLVPDSGAGHQAERGTVALPDDASVCSCNNVSARAVRDAVRHDRCTDLAAVKACTRAGTSCGSCLPLVKALVTTELEAAGVEVSKALCEHFDLSRAQLFDVVRVTGITSFSELVERHGRGRGCDICKPVVASVLASVHHGHVLEGERAALQDTNDHVLANIQKDGTYSVVPRIPGGEVTPDGLIAIGAVAKEFGLYTKITGGQRIDLFGARIEQLPAVWSRLVDAGFESGHAYGKSLRTVKSCVGSTWCRYGVQDAVGLAVALELRYRGLRSPHKLKLGVSGCARECAEARGKDVGIIATENGWNLYVGGNGGFTPRHARLLAEDLDTATLVRTIDRFLMYYVRTADRLQRTAPWLDDVEGGLEHVRAVVLEDSLGIAADLDAAMDAHVDGYVDEWRATLEDPEKLRRFAAFVNAPGTADPDLAYVPERGQRRPATPAEREAGPGDPVHDPHGNTAVTPVRHDGSAPQPLPGRRAHEPDDAVLIAGPRLEVVSR
ncbi:MAG: nitrite reductase large subunit [Actinobacteria bacterium]|nr:nitrite reductase large subunit [Actinomycetota bacterium]